MLLREDEFQRRYGSFYQEALCEAQDVAAHPERQKAALDSEKAGQRPLQLRAPQPDPYAYRAILSRGFVRYQERLKNYIVAHHEPKAAMRSFLPTLMDIEPNSRCNFRCVMCQVSEWENGTRTDDMTLEELQAFVECQPGLTEVKLRGMGEPLLHPRYIEMVQYLVGRDLWVRTNTNSSVLHARDNYRRLIDSGIGEIQTSVDGATKDVFEKIRRRSNFEQVVRNLTLLNQYANRQDRPYTRMWVVVQQYNRHQIFEFVELAKRMECRRLTFSLTLNDWGQDQWHAKNAQLQSLDLSEEEQQRLLDVMAREGIEITVWRQATKYSTESPDTLCPWVFGRPYISSDSRVVPCSMIANPDVMDLGDATDFERVWNGPAYQAFRQRHLSGDIPTHCRHCYKMP
ncbi:MAG: radical SAM protein [Candidatus Omnitrophota bacterium]|nr:radical SAM protein [Candidatus Omnitrophota bacterium]